MIKNDSSRHTATVFKVATLLNHIPIITCGFEKWIYYQIRGHNNISSLLHYSLNFFQECLSCMRILSRRHQKFDNMKNVYAMSIFKCPSMSFYWAYLLAMFFLGIGTVTTLLLFREHCLRLIESHFVTIHHF